jgi:hypothetical protein
MNKLDQAVKEAKEAIKKYKATFAKLQGKEKK